MGPAGIVSRDTDPGFCGYTQHRIGQADFPHTWSRAAPIPGETPSIRAVLLFPTDPGDSFLIIKQHLGGDAQGRGKAFYIQNRGKAAACFDLSKVTRIGITTFRSFSRVIPARFRYFFMCLIKVR
jgi:hypothetical protein